MRILGLVVLGLLLCGLIVFMASSDPGSKVGESGLSTRTIGANQLPREEVIMPAQTPQERDAQERSGTLPDGYLSAREAIEARYGANAQHVISRMDESSLQRPMMDPELATDQFIERLDPVSGPIAATMYRGLVSWPGMTLHSPPIVPLGNLAELGWQHLPVGQNSLQHLDESFVFEQAEALAASYNVELDRLARDYVDRHFGILSSRVRSGSYEQHPSGMTDLSPSGWGQGLPKSRHTVGGWSLKVTMDQSDWEALRELHVQIQEVRDSRRDYLKVKLSNL